MDETKEITDTKLCECEKPKTELRNYDMMWHDGEVWCLNCEGFVRFWDAG